MRIYPNAAEIFNNFSCLAPRVGLEPTTTRLTAARSTSVTLAYRNVR